MTRAYLRTPFFVLLAAIMASAPSLAGDDRLFNENAIIHGDGTVTLPLFEGRSGGLPIWYILTEASDGEIADEFGIARADKLENALGTAAVQRGFRDAQGLINFPASVDFSPERVVAGDPETGFPPLQALPGSIGEPGYSPLVTLDDQIVLNASHVANGSGIHDRVVSIDFAAGTVRYELVDGFARDNAVLYITTDASAEVPAALEGVTFAPALNAAPFVGGDGTDSARASLAAVVNGATGVDNPDRQGLNSALFGEGDPLNNLAWLPNQGRYSPLWDVFLTAFADGVRPRLQTHFFDIEDLGEDGLVTAPDGSPWGPSGFIVNCPIIVELDD